MPEFYKAWAVLLLMLTLGMLPSGGYAQQHGGNWYFGKRAGLSFTEGSARAVADGDMNSYEGSASASTATGELLMYSNGEQVWDASHHVMPNGKDLGGHTSASQGALILRGPGSGSAYYLFTVDAIDNNLAGGLRYSVIDMALRNGLGDVTASKSVRLPTPTLLGKVTEKLTAALHANGRDYWVIVHGWQSNEFYSFLLSAQGLSAEPVVSSAGTVHTGGASFFASANANGYLRLSPDGTKLALAMRDKQAELFDFDNATGRVTGGIALTTGSPRYYGIEFSPDNSRLYVSTYSGNGASSDIYQFNVAAGSAEAIQASGQLIGSVTGLAATLQAGPDKRIYVSFLNKNYLSLIENPNALGKDAGFRENGISLGAGISLNSLPNFPNAFAVNEWTGAADASYSNPANWQNRVVPGPGDDVFIRATAARMPVLSGEVAVRDLVVEKGAALTLNGVLTLHGSLWNQGSCGGRGVLASAGAGQHRLGGNPMTLGELRVDFGAEARLAGPVQVRRVLLLDGDLHTNGQPLTLLSAADGSALVVRRRGAVTGAVTVQRFLGAKGGRSCDWLLASPVQKPLGGPLAAGLPAAPPARGYARRLPPQTLSFVGELNDGEYSVGELTRTAAPESGWWLLGNPYPAPLRWDKLLAGATGLDQAVYTLRAAGPYAGQYASFVRGVGVNGGSNTLALGEAFFVRTTRPGTTGRLTFANAARQTTYETPVPAAETRPLLALALLGDKAASEVAVYFDAGATAAFDPAFDAYRMRSPRGPQLSIPAQGQQLAIQALPLPAALATTVPLLVRVAKVGTYTFRATRLLNLPPGAGAYLRDAQTGQLIDLRQAAYTFQSAGAAEYGRFALLLTTPPAPAAPAAWLGLPDSLARKNVVVQLYNTVGKLVQAYQLSPRGAAALSLSLAGLIQGIYVMQLLGRLGRMNQHLRTRRQRTGVA